MTASDDTRTYAMLAKPVSGACNLCCEYCYYSGKENALHIGTARMSDETLESYIRQSLAMHGSKARVEFAWHGGEPTLAGQEFYEKAVRLQERYGKGQVFAVPPGIHGIRIRHPVTPFSVTPQGYGDFLCAVFDIWKEKDAGRKHVQLIDVAIGNLKGIPSGLCVHNPLCGHSGCVEANGDVYSCDRYAFDDYRLGNIMENGLDELMEANRSFGMHKMYGLPEKCLDCPEIRLCFGGCPKDRLWENRNYLCEGYLKYFSHIRATCKELQ